MLTAHSNVLRIYVARFPASSRNFFIPFAPHPRGHRSFVRPRQSVQQPVSFHRAAPGKIPLFDVLFVRRLIFQRSKHEPGNHVPPRPRPLINPDQSSDSLARWIPDQQAYTWSYSWIPSYWFPCYRVMDSVSVCSIRACQYAHAFSGIRARACSAVHVIRFRFAAKTLPLSIAQRENGKTSTWISIHGWSIHFYRIIRRGGVDKIPRRKYLSFAWLVVSQKKEAEMEFGFC